MKRGYYHGPLSDHFDGERFFNTHGASGDRDWRDLWRWRRERNPASWDTAGEAAGAVAATDRPPARVTMPRVAMVGHASLLVQVPGCNILVDPIWSERASPVPFAGPRRFQPPGIAFDDLPVIDVVMITHNHYDHLDIPTLKRLWRRDRPHFVAPLGNDVLLRRHISALRADTADWWDSVQLADDVRVTLCPANHWSSRTPWDRRRALWCGYVVESRGGNIYIAGDTGFGDGSLFAAVGGRFPDLAAAALPIGAYEPRWFMADQHMNPEEAVRALLGCGARQGLGVHWGTFHLTDESRMAPVDALAQALADRSAPGFCAMAPGEVWQEGNSTLEVI